MQIVNLMTPDPITIDQHDTLSNAKRLMDEGRFRRLPVMDNEQLVGILTERDLREYTGYLESTRVTAAMRTPLITVDAVQQGRRCCSPNAEAQNRRPAGCG